MKKLKLIWGNWLKKIKKWEIVKMLNYKNEIKLLNTKIDELNEDIRNLRDLNYIYKIEYEELEESRIRIASLEQVLEASDKQIKKLLESIKKLDSMNNDLMTKSFNLELELKSKEIQIKEYQTEGRYLVKKLKPDRTKSKIKTKISKPMASNVVKYMREEHE